MENLWGAVSLGGRAFVTGRRESLISAEDVLATFWGRTMFLLMACHSWYPNFIHIINEEIFLGENLIWNQVWVAVLSCTS